MKHYILSVVVSVLFSASAFGALTAPETISTGQLAVVKSDAAATWSVYPAEYRSAIYIADDGKTCVFASPEPGAVTFIAASAVDGKVDLEEITLYNGIAAPDQPEPTPAPQPKPETVETIVADADVDATAEEFNALAAAFETAISGINRGTIRTPAGARETFRAVWIRQAATVNPDAIATFSALLATLGDKVDNSTLATIKTDYAAIVAALKERSAKATKAATDAEAAAGQPKTAKPTTSSCPNGQCPANGNGYYWRFR